MQSAETPARTSSITAASRSRMRMFSPSMAKGILALRADSSAGELLKFDRSLRLVIDLGTNAGERRDAIEQPAHA